MPECCCTRIQQRAAGLPELAAFLCAQVPATSVVARAQARVRKKQMECTDRRVKVTSEVISGESSKKIGGQGICGRMCGSMRATAPRS